MPKKILAVLLFVAAVVAAAVTAYVFYWKVPDYEYGAKSPTNRSSGLVVGKSAIYVTDQAPSSEITVEFALLEMPGFVVVHESRNDKPGQIIGASELLPAGKASDFTILLSRKARDGEELFAMLHKDDGDGIFNPVKDAPITEAGGEPVMTLFAIDASAEPPGAVSL